MYSFDTETADVAGATVGPPAIATLKVAPSTAAVDAAPVIELFDAGFAAFVPPVAPSPTKSAFVGITIEYAAVALPSAVRVTVEGPETMMSVIAVPVELVSVGVRFTVPA